MIGPGSRLGPYEIAAQIGEGGMGLVFKARDFHLGREVALKVLPEGFTQDPERVARFEREARLLATLNHPNIAQIYGLENAPDGTRALAMELVEGPTLAERLAQGRLPVDESLSLARQIAEALEEAHERGIVHRDLKPQNIKASIEGKVKVLDFGLAKAMDAAASVSSGSASAAHLQRSPTLMNSPTLTAVHGTQLGVILGTAAYMSPEQAKGRPVDKRADVWAFGVVLYEMLTGRRLFGGETVSETIAEVLKTEIELSALPPQLPPGLRTLMRRCLERDPRHRLRDIGEARIALEPAVLADASAAGLAAVRAPRAGWRVALPWTLAAGLALALGWVWVDGRGAATAGPGRTRILAMRLPAGVSLPLDDRGIYGQTGILAISPDGQRVAYVAGFGDAARLYVRDLASFEPTAIEGTGGASSPFFSPDGRWIGYFSPGRLRKVAVGGGKPIELAEAGLDRGAVWCPDGSIVYAPNVASGLYRLPAGGGAPVPLTRLDLEQDERTHRWPAVLPGGREVAFTVGKVGQPGDYESSAIDAVELATGTRRPLFRGASMIRFTGSGHALLGREGQVLALPLAGARGEGTEDAVQVLNNVAGVPASGAVHFDVAADGTLVYAERDPRAAELELAWMARDGGLTSLGLPPRDFHIPRLSPDGRRIAVGIGPGGGRASDIWLHDLGTGSLTRLTFEGNSSAPIWSPDGRSVAYSTLTPAGAEAFRLRPADGSSEPRTLLEFEQGLARELEAWLPDGSLLASEDAGTGSASNLVFFPPGAAEPLPLARSPAIEIQGVVSPDGRYVAYAHDESGEAALYVQPFPPTGAKWQVAAAASIPRWSRDGQELFFLQGRQLMAAPVSTAGTFTSGSPRKLLEVPSSVVLSSDTSTNYDVAADGRFLVVRSTSSRFMAGHVVVALDWHEALRRAVPIPEP